MLLVGCCFEGGLEGLGQGGFGTIYEEANSFLLGGYALRVAMKGSCDVSFWSKQVRYIEIFLSMALNTGCKGTSCADQVLF